MADSPPWVQKREQALSSRPARKREPLLQPERTVRVTLGEALGGGRRRGCRRHLLTDDEQGAFKVDWVRTFQAGIDEIQIERHDVYVLDHRLGAHSGGELLQQAISRGCTAPMIMLTGVTSHETVVAAMKAGAADYLVKGNIDELLLKRTLRFAVRARRAAEASRAAHNRFRAAFTGSPAGMALVDVSANAIGRLLDVNPALCGMTQRDSRELLEREIWDLFEGAGQSVRELLERKDPDGGLELQLIRSTGERRGVSLHVSIVNDSRERPMQAIAQIVDITGQKETETSLQHLAGQDPLMVGSSRS